jgi:hypothetical protein
MLVGLSKFRRYNLISSKVSLKCHEEKRRADREVQTYDLFFSLNLAVFRVETPIFLQKYF